ncbi:MAG: hypothetical protein MR008_00820 [Aerococcus sp.]|nr:hypothetical protein [Aerococcus sp.]
MNNDQKKYALIALGAIAVSAAVGAFAYHKEKQSHTFSHAIDEVSDKVNDKFEEADVKGKVKKAKRKAVKVAKDVAEDADVDDVKEIPESVREWLKGLD